MNSDKPISIPDFNKKIVVVKKEPTNLQMGNPPKKGDNNFLTFFYIFLSVLILATGYFIYFLFNN